MDSKDTVVIVGAGPVGLWISCQLRLLVPSLHVVVIEKREDYVREHILKLKIKYMKTSKIKNEDFENLKKKIDGKTPTKLLEGELKGFAEKLGVKIIIGKEIKSLADVYNHIPKHKIFALFGCDGRRSTVRSKIMKKYSKGDKLSAFSKLWLPILYPLDLVNRIWAYNLLNRKSKIDEEFNMIEEEVFLHQLMLKYSIQGQGKTLSHMDYYKTLKLLSYPATEIVGRYVQNEDKTEATCIFILDKDTASQVKHFSPQHPGKFNVLNDKVKESVNIWMNAKQELTGQKIIEGSERLVYVPISVYCACDFIDQSNDFPIAIAGDAAYGVPYFKALNTGLECGTKLVELISEVVNKHKSLNDKIKDYQKYMADKVYTLFSQSQLRSHQFKFAINAFSAHNKIPWQFIKWSNGDFKKKLYKNFDPHFEENNEYKNIQQNKPEDYGVQIEEVEEVNKQQEQILQLEKQESEKLILEEKNQGSDSIANKFNIFS